MKREDALRLELLIRRVGIRGSELGCNINNYEEWYIDRDGDLVFEKISRPNWIKRLFCKKKDNIRAIAKATVLKVIATKLLNILTRDKVEELKEAIVHKFTTGEDGRLLHLILGLSNEFKWKYDGIELDTETILNRINRGPKRRLKIREIINENDRGNHVTINTQEGSIRFSKNEVGDNFIGEILHEYDKSEAVQVSQKSIGEPITIIEKTEIKPAKEFIRHSEDWDRGF